MMSIKSKNEEFAFFNQLSDEWWNENGKFKILHQIKSHRMTYILDQIENRDIKNLKILDVGCGGGIICEPLARLGAKVTGIDFAPNNINAAKIHSKKNKLKINYIHKDVEKSKLDGKFDLILMFEVLEHLDDWKKTIKKIKKNLNKNGLIIIFIIIGLYIVLDMRDHNFKRAVDACVAGSQKLSETKITDLNEAKKFCEDQIRKNNE